MKKAVYGKCHICGEYGELSFEHIPPQAALNKGQVKAYSGEEILKTFHGERARYQNMQRGMGRFSLCKSCNNTTGQWYAATYCQVAKEVASSRSKAEQLQHGDCIEYTFKNLPALAFVKQVIAMFCSLLPWEEVHRLGFDQLLLNKESNLVDTRLFDLRVYLASPDTAQLLTSPSVVLYTSNENVESCYVTDLCAYPFGFILNLSPEVPVEYGTSLMEWFRCEYSKLIEYDVPNDAYPNFPVNSNDLSFSTVYILSRYAESIIENDAKHQAEFRPYLEKAAQYYDAAFESKERLQHDQDFLITGAVAYFLHNDFGSAKVLCSKVSFDLPVVNTPFQLLVVCLRYLLASKTQRFESDISCCSNIYKSLLTYFRLGDDDGNTISWLCKYRQYTFNHGNALDDFYVDLLYVVVVFAMQKSAWSLLPQHSGITVDVWRSYLDRREAVKILWQSQELLCTHGVLRGNNAIVELPTGVGKTKSIELIIRAAQLSNRAREVIIVAPLRALCNEITHDLQCAFRKDDVEINRFSDVLEDDYSFDLLSNDSIRISICTPEKLNYIIHHQPEICDMVGLFVLDEAHILEHYAEADCFNVLQEKIINAFASEQDQQIKESIIYQLSQRKQALDAVENYLCFVYGTPISLEQDIHENIGESICKDTLAYYLADEEEKGMLLSVFRVIEEKVAVLSERQRVKYSASMTAVDCGKAIEAWIDEIDLLNHFYTEMDMLQLVVSLYFSLYRTKLMEAELLRLCQQWIEGEMPLEMLKESSFTDIDQLMATCHETISYELSFLVGNIIDLLPESDDENIGSELYSNLSLLQRKLKYGVPNLTAISVCESLFWDRHIAIEIATMIRNESATSSDLDAYLLYNKDNILEYLENMPSYFTERFSTFINRKSGA